MLFPGSSKPLYIQLRDILQQKIHDREFRPGDALPGERQLMEEYSVSRVTVRQAIAELVREGQILRRHGKGNFISEPKLELPQARLLGIAEELQLRNLEPILEVMETGFEAPSQTLIEKLNLNQQQVYKVVRLISFYDGPALIDFSYFPQTIGKQLEGMNFSQDLIYLQLERFGYKISHGSQSLGAKLLSVEEAKLLNCKEGEPGLVAERITFVQGDTPIQYSHTVYRADQYHYQVYLQRRPFTEEK